jgi:hypothetical protein
MGGLVNHLAMESPNLEETKTMAEDPTLVARVSTTHDTALVVVFTPQLTCSPATHASTNQRLEDDVVL